MRHIFLFLLLGCASVPKRVPPPPAAKVAGEEPVHPCGAEVKLEVTGEPIHVAADDFVTLERESCFGMCPVYSVTVRGDGRVSAVGLRYVAHEGPLEWSIDPAVAQRLLAEFVRVNAFSLEATMTSTVTDLAKVRLKFQIGERRAEISHYGAGHELALGLGGRDNAALTRLELLVDRISEAETRIVGCTSAE